MRRRWVLDERTINLSSQTRREAQTLLRAADSNMAVLIHSVDTGSACDFARFVLGPHVASLSGATRHRALSDAAIRDAWRVFTKLAPAVIKAIKRRRL